jgi:hypothetical protein
MYCAHVLQYLELSKVVKGEVCASQQKYVLWKHRRNLRACPGKLEDKLQIVRDLQQERAVDLHVMSTGVCKKSNIAIYINICFN